MYVLVIRLRIAKTRKLLRSKCCEAQSTWTVNVAFRLFLYLAETWGEYVKTTQQNIYGSKKITLPSTECYVVFTGERKDKPSVISLFDEFAAPLARSLPSLDLGCPSSKLAPDEGILDLKVRVIFGGAGSDILQQYIAFSKECDKQFAQKGRTMEALTCAIERCKRRGILREYLEAREKEVIKIMTMLFDQGVSKRNCPQGK